MLFWKECRRILLSVVYILYFIMVLFVFTSQVEGDIAVIGPPEPGRPEYGRTVREDPEILMPAAAVSLLNDYLNNNYVTYPIGFIRYVHLKDKDAEKMGILLEMMTGMDIGELEKLRFREPEYAAEDYNGYTLDVPVDPSLSYEDFLTLMDEADSILGGGSSYARENIARKFSTVPMTYEEAKAEYDSFITDDKVTNGYARLFCDYHGIFLVLLPAFVIAVFCTADRRGRMEELIYARRISSAKLVLTRYAALLCMLFLPVLVTAVWADIQAAQAYPDTALDRLAMYKYTLIWLVPTLVAVTGINMLVTETFSGISAVVLQFAAWFVSLLTAGMELTGTIQRFNIMVRHNSHLEREVFLDQIGTFAFNRCFFTALGLLCAVLTIVVYKRKREGKFHGFRVLGKVLHRQSQN